MSLDARQGGPLFVSIGHCRSGEEAAAQALVLLFSQIDADDNHNTVANAADLTTITIAVEVVIYNADGVSPEFGGLGGLVGWLVC